MPPKRSTGTGVSYTDGDDERLRELNRAHQRQYRERRKEKFRLLEERVQLLERELARVRQSGSVYPPSTSTSIGLPAESSTSLLSIAPSNDEDQVPSIALDPDADQVPPTQQNLAQIRARLIAVEAENTAYKVMLRQQRNFLLQSYLQNLPPIPPTPPQQLQQPLVNEPATIAQYTNPFTTVEEPTDHSWRDFLNLDEAETDLIGNRPDSVIADPISTLLTPRSTFISLTEIVSDANRLILLTDINDAQITPNCDTSKQSLLTIPSLSTNPDLVHETVTTFLDMLVYGMNLEKSRCTPDPVEFGKLVMNVAMTKYRMLDKCKIGREREQVLDLVTEMRYGRNEQAMILVAKQLPSLFLLDLDAVGIQECPLTLIKQETDVFYGQCMHIPALCGNAFVERLFEGAKSLLENQGSSERETILQSRCFWYQCYLHSVIPLLCTEEERLKLERIVDRGRIERKAAFDNLVDALDALELK